MEHRDPQDDKLNCKYVLLLKRMVVFPGSLIGFHVTDSDLLSCLLGSWRVAMLPFIETSGPEVACLCELVRLDRIGTRSAFFLFSGITRVRVKLAEKPTESSNCVRLESVEELEEIYPPELVASKLKEEVKELLWKVNPNAASVLEKVWDNLPLGRLVDQIVYITSMNVKLKYEFLQELNVELRAAKLIDTFKQLLKHYPMRHVKYRKRWITLNVN